MYYFIYGTVKRGGVNSMCMNMDYARQRDSHYQIKGYKLYVIPEINIPFITPSDNNEDVVWGELWQTTSKSTINRLRELEGYHPDIDPKYCLYLEKEVGKHNNEPVYAYVWNREILDGFRVIRTGEFDVEKCYR